MAGTGKQGWAEFFSFPRRSKNLRARRVRLLSLLQFVSLGRFCSIGDLRAFNVPSSSLSRRYSHIFFTDGCEHRSLNA